MRWFTRTQDDQHLEIRISQSTLLRLLCQQNISVSELRVLNRKSKHELHELVIEAAKQHME